MINKGTNDDDYAGGQQVPAKRRLQVQPRERQPTFSRGDDGLDTGTRGRCI